MNFLINLCSNSDFLTILMVIFRVIKLFCYIVPVLLILMISIDFGKNVISGSEDDMRKSTNIVVKRIIYCIAVFFAPTIVSFVINLIPDDPIIPNTSSNSIKKCITNATPEKIDEIKNNEEAFKRQKQEVQQNKQRIASEIETTISELDSKPVPNFSGGRLDSEYNSYTEAKEKYNKLKEKGIDKATPNELIEIQEAINKWQKRVNNK